MRRLNSGELKAIGQVTRARELSALAELSAITVRMRSAEARIAALPHRTPDAATPQEARLLARWLVWREGKLKTETAELARIRAAHREAALRCGRLIAENDVVGKLRRRARVEEAQQRERRAGFTSPDGRYP